MLQELCRRIGARLRRIDGLGRLGGEEFIVILPNMAAELLPVVAERCRNAIAESVYQTEGKRIQVTASIGACMARPSDTCETLIERADRLMYASKKRGRNLSSFDE